MNGIGGNITALLQICTTTKNSIGEQIPAWSDVQSIKGWLDLSSGEARYSNFNSKIQESTHVFVADYVTIPANVTSENSRMIISGKRYDVLLIDNPMEMKTGSQLEIYLKYTGGQ